MIYFDNAATTQIEPEVIKEMVAVMNNYFGNPSSIHTFGMEARVIIENARKSIASFLNVNPSEIFFTSCGTEAISMSINSCINDIGIKHIVTSLAEHKAVLQTIESLSKKGLCDVSFVKLDNKGNIILEDLENILSKSERSLVCLMHANNETGNLLSLKNTSEICLKYNSLLFCDMVQTMAKFRNDIGNLNIHFAACSAHKFHGPKGIGFLYKNNNIKISPMFQGGGQEMNMRSGTENIYGIAGMAKAFEVAHKSIDKNIEYICSLKKYMIKRLREEISDIQFNGESEENGLYTILNVSFPVTKKSDMLLYKLDIEGIAASSGSACSSGSIKTSHVLKAIGADLTRTSIRFSFSKFNKTDEIDKCVDVIKKVL